jgi:hypothetical protein
LPQQRFPVQVTTLPDCDDITHFDGILQCCGSMTFWGGSGSGFADPAIFVNDLQDASKKLIFYNFFCLLLFEGTFISFFKDKKSKKGHKIVGIKVFLTIFEC